MTSTKGVGAGSPASPASRNSLPLFAIGALAIYGVVETTAPDADTPEKFDLTIRDEAFSTVPATQITFEPDEAQHEPSLIEAAETADELVDVAGRQAERLVAAAHASGYQSRSGHELNWDAAAVQAYRDVQLVTVPLTGNVLDGVSKVVFMHQADTTSVVEMAAIAVDLASPFHAEGLRGRAGDVKSAPDLG